MHTQKTKLPEKSVMPLYNFKSWAQNGPDTPAHTTSHSDPTNFCTTILSSTHYLPK